MTGKRERTSIRQTQIAAAAADLICEHGSEHITIKDLAVHVGLTEGAIYRHFNTKKDIYLFLIDYIEEILISDFKPGRRAARPGHHAVDRLLEKHLAAIESRKGLAFQVIAEIVSLGDRDLNRRTLSAIENYIDCIAWSINERMSKKATVGHRRSSRYLATLIFTLIQGLVNLWALSGYSFNLKRRFMAMWCLYEGAAT